MTDTINPIAEDSTFFDVEMEEPDVISFDSVEEIERSIVEAPFRAIYQRNDFLIPQLKSIIDEEKTLNLRPEYQRRSAWTLRQKSLLIESFMLNIPIPPVFLFEYDYAHYEVMDGQQRILSIKEFLDNEYSLSGLTILSPLNGKSYRQLPPRTRRTLERASLSAIILVKESRSSLKDSITKRILELRRFVFERLNTGGKRLNAQELRNAIYASSFNQGIIETASWKLFTDTWGIPPWNVADSKAFEAPSLKANTLYRSMNDCEIVLRFFALRDQSKIKGSMRSILDGCMERNLETPLGSIAGLMVDFRERFQTAVTLFDGAPFRLEQTENAKPSVGMYDAVIVAVDHLWDHRENLIARKEAVQRAYWDHLGGMEDFAKYTGRANTAGDTRERISEIERVFKSALG